MLRQPVSSQLYPTEKPVDRSTNTPRYFWWVILVLLIVALLGIIGLNQDALWFDEIYSFIYAGGEQYGPISAGDVLTRVTEQLHHEKNPPGYYVLLHFWIDAVGSTPFAGRALSLLVGLLGLAWTYRFGREIALRFGMSSGDLIGFAAAVAVGASAFFIYYLHEIRVYSLIVCISAFECWAYFRLIRANQKLNRWLLVVFSLCAAASLYLHYQAALILVTLGLYHLFFVKKDRRWLEIALAAVVTGLLFLPWVWAIYTFSSKEPILPAVTMNVGQILPSLALTFSNNSVALLVLLAALALYNRFSVVKTVGFLVIGGVIVAIVVNRVYPFINQIRYIIYLWPLLAVMVGLGIERLVRSKLSAVVPLSIWAAAAVLTIGDAGFNHYLTGTILPWREFHSELEQHMQPGDALTFHSGDFDWIRVLELDHYMYGLPIRYKLMEYIQGKPDNDDYFNHAREYIANTERVWVAVSHTDPANFRLGEFQRALSIEGFGECYSGLDAPSVSLDLYARLPRSQAETPLHFGDGIGLKLVEPPVINPDGMTSVVLGTYKDASVPNGQYSIALHVVDGSGNLVAQADYGLPDAQNDCHKMMLNVPPGAYTLRAAVYNWQTGERLMGVDTATGEQADRLQVTAFTVK